MRTAKTIGLTIPEVLVKEVYHVAKNSEEIGARDAAAFHGWGICPGGCPDIYRTHRERVRAGRPEAFQREDGTGGGGACPLRRSYEPRAAVHVRRAGSRQRTRGPGGGWTYGPAREISEGPAGHRPRGLHRYPGRRPQSRRHLAGGCLRVQGH